MTIPQDNLLARLTQANVCCSDCGLRYGKYSVGCSSVYNGTCDVCGEEKPITEVRDYGYFQRGISEIKGNIKEQSKKVADYMLSAGPIMNDEELEDALTPSYKQGEIVCKFTETEVAALLEMIEFTRQSPEWQTEEYEACDSVRTKMLDLFEDYCVTYGLSPALKAYNEKYGTWGTESPEEVSRWHGFRDAFELLNSK